jgi:hypothetical protein
MTNAEEARIVAPTPTPTAFGDAGIAAKEKRDFADLPPFWSSAQKSSAARNFL